MASVLGEKDAIREVLAEYCFRLDADRFEELAALLTADGTWETAFGMATGRTEIARLARRLAERRAPRPRRVHCVTNIVNRLAGMRANVASNWLLIENASDGPRIVAGGGYADEMVKKGGAWLFRHRRIDRFIADA